MSVAENSAGDRNREERTDKDQKGGGSMVGDTGEEVVKYNGRGYGGRERKREGGIEKREIRREQAKEFLRN